MSQAEEEPSEVWEAITEIETELALPDRFTWQLYQQSSDWTFVVMLHALIETTISHLLTLHFKEPVVNTILLLPLDGRTSKLQIICDLGEYPPEYMNYLKELSKIRNKLVHNIKNLGFSLRNYISKLSQQEKKQFVKKVGFGTEDMPVGPDGNKYTRDEFVVAFPREALFFGGIVWLHTLHLNMETLRLKKDLAQLGEQVRKENRVLAERYIKLMESLSKKN